VSLTIGLGRFSSLSLWWIEQGIEVAFMHPASPQENGSHERTPAEFYQPSARHLCENDKPIIYVAD